MARLILGKACRKIGSGSTPRGGSSVYLEKGVALIRSQNVCNEGFSYDGLVHIDSVEAERLSNVEVASGDNLLNITGDSVARTCQVPDDVLPARVNQHVAIVRPDHIILNPRFLHYHLVSPKMQMHMLNLAGSGATRKALTKEMIEAFEMETPSLHTQTTIADHLGAFDDKIDVNSRISKSLESIARTIFKSWFVDFDPVRAKAEGKKPLGMDDETAALYPDSFEDTKLGETPRGWRIGRLDDLLVLQRGFDLPVKARTPGKFPIISAGGESGSHNEYKAKGPGVVVGRSGLLGGVFFVNDEFWPLNTTLWIKEYKRSAPHHGYFLLQTIDYESFNAGSAVPTLNRNHIHPMPAVLPPRELVEKFAEIAGPIFLTLRALRDQSLTLGDIRDTTLPKLLSGEIRIPISRDEEADKSMVGAQ